MDVVITEGKVRVLVVIFFGIMKMCFCCREKKREPIDEEMGMQREKWNG
jgi:hypothetical protein